MMILYGQGRNRWVKPYWTLKELGVEFQTEIVSPRKIATDHPEFLKINPFGKVPALRDGDFTLLESAAICTYLADKYAEKNLIPKSGTKARGLHDQWVSFATSELEQPLWRIIKHTFLYPPEKRSAADIELAKEDFLNLSSKLEGQLSDYLVDGKFSVADIVMTYTLNWADGMGLVTPRSRCESYIRRHKSRPNFPYELYK